MAKLVRHFLITVFIVGVAVAGAYCVFIYSMGKNFVHDQPASEEYYQNISNRIYFKTKYRGDKFDTLLQIFLQTHPMYAVPDSVNPRFIGDSSCDCNCFSLERYVYFNNSPKEIYYLTYSTDTMYATGAGVIDIIYLFKNEEWSCLKTSRLNSTEKARIKNRLDTAILQKLD